MGLYYKVYSHVYIWGVKRTDQPKKFWVCLQLLVHSQVDICAWCAWQPSDHLDGDAEEIVQVPDQHVPGQPGNHRPPSHPYLHSHQGFTHQQT